MLDNPHPITNSVIEGDQLTKLFLTYDNQAKQDGVGAQLQRVFGLYAISKKWRLGYVHSNLTGTVEELSHNLDSNDKLNELLDLVNSKFQFPSNTMPLDYKEIRVHNLSLRFLLRIYLRTVFSRETILLKVCLPYGLIEKYPDWYDFAGEEIRIQKSLNKNSMKDRVVIHIRHGYKPIPGKNGASTPRFLPLEYYPLALSNLFKNEQLDKRTEVLIHTDLPESDGKWKPYQESKISELEEIGYEFSNQELEYKTVDLKTLYFADYPNLTVKYCAPILEALEDMYTAKHLIMSRSSFSYIAGIINPGNVYIPRQHGHVKLTRWFWDFEKDEVPSIELLSGI